MMGWDEGRGAGEGDKIGGGRDMRGKVKVLGDGYGAGMEGGMEMRAI
jgi:hypothetical protein